MTHGELFVDPEDIFNSIEHAVEEVPARTDIYGNTSKTYSLSDEELTGANLYLDLFVKHPAEAISLYYEIPAESHASAEYESERIEAAVHHSVGRLTTFFTFHKDAEGNITAHKSLHTEEVDDDTNVVRKAPKDFLTQQWIDSSFERMLERAQSNVNIQSIKVDEMMAISAILSTLYKT